jgi:cytosine deaminase
MISSSSARILNHRDYGIAVGLPADLVALDCKSGMEAVCELAQPLFGLKKGRRTFDRPEAVLHHPG